MGGGILFGVLEEWYSRGFRDGYLYLVVTYFCVGISFVRQAGRRAGGRVVC